MRRTGEEEKRWSRLGSNQRPSACEADALPLSHGTSMAKELLIAPSRNTSTVGICAEHSRWVTQFVGSTPRALSSCFATGDQFARSFADVAQLVAHHLAKVRVAGSNPVIRSKVQLGINPPRWSGRVVRQRPAKPCTRVRFPSPPPIDLPARLAQRESASLTRKRSLVQSQYRAPRLAQVRICFLTNVEISEAILSQ